MKQVFVVLRLTQLQFSVSGLPFHPVNHWFQFPACGRSYAPKAILLKIPLDRTSLVTCPGVRASSEQDYKICGDFVLKLGLPDRCLVVALIQQDYVRVPGAGDHISPHDTAILLVEDDVVDAALALFSPAK